MVKLAADGFLPLLEIPRAQVLSGIGGLIRKSEDAAHFWAFTVQARVNFRNGDRGRHDVPARAQPLLQRGARALEKPDGIAGDGRRVHLSQATCDRAGCLTPSRAVGVS